MVLVQCGTGQELKTRVEKYVLGVRDESLEDILDDIQLLYNDDELSSADYTLLMCILEDYI